MTGQIFICRDKFSKKTKILEKKPSLDLVAPSWIKEFFYFGKFFENRNYVTKRSEIIQRPFILFFFIRYPFYSILQSQIKILRQYYIILAYKIPDYFIKCWKLEFRNVGLQSKSTVDLKSCNTWFSFKRIQFLFCFVFITTHSFINNFIIIQM